MELEHLLVLNRRIAGCTACTLSAGRTQTVPGDGDPDAELMFIGEGPGFHEDRQGRPFVGRAGKLLDELLAGIELTRADVFVANVVKCRPPQNRDPQPNEIAACEPFLREQIESIRPKLIVPLGRFATQYFIPRAVMGRSRGAAAQAGRWRIYPVYHPAAALRQASLLQVLRGDFARIPQLLAESQRPSPLSQTAAAQPGGEQAEGEQPGGTQLALL